MNKRLTWFIVLVLSLSWILSSSVKVFHLSESPLSVVMALPMAVALVFMVVSREKFSAVGWKIPKIKYILISIAFPIFQMALIVGIGFLFGLLTINDKHVATFKPTSFVWLNLALYIPAMFIPYLLLSLPHLLMGWINHLGEEFAWRGYLFREFAGKRGRLIKAVLLSGLVWWAWHVPMFWFSPVVSTLRTEKFVLTLLLSFFALIGAAFVYCWIYIKSGSIWAPTLMHLFWNLYRGVLTGRLSDGEPGLFKGDLWLINGEGILGMTMSILTGMIFAFLLLRHQRKYSASLLEQKQNIFTSSHNL
jgi:membrane protease YdiL (CAAX protease family)